MDFTKDLQKLVENKTKSKQFHEVVSIVFRYVTFLSFLFHVSGHFIRELLSTSQSLILLYPVFVP